jgi:hypothetical protein
MRKAVAEVQDLVGYPEWTLIDNGTKLSPLESWAPPPGRNKVSAEDLYELFHKKCIAFLGDSLQRRAADTLHALIEHRGNTSQIDEYVYDLPNMHSRATRMIGSRPPSSKNDTQYKKHCEPGTIDNMWLPTLKSIGHFKYEKNHTVLIASCGPWDQKRDYSPNDWKKVVIESIHGLYNSVPNSVLIYWKTSPWGWHSAWNFLEPNQTSGKKTSNYLVYYANEVARETIDSINASNLILLDWSKEILPYSFSERVPTNMKAEGNDGSEWHVGPKGRALLLQMLASEIIQQKQHGGVKPFDMKESPIKNYLQVGFYLGAIIMVIMMSKRTKRKTPTRPSNRSQSNAQAQTCERIEPTQPLLCRMVSKPN